MTKLNFNYYIHTLLYSKYKFILFLTFYFICIQIHYFDFTQVADCMPSTVLAPKIEKELAKSYNAVEAQANQFEVYRDYKEDSLQEMYKFAKDYNILINSPAATTNEGKGILTIYHFIYEHKLLVIENERLQNQVTVLNQEVARLNNVNTDLQTTLENLQNQEHHRLLDGVEQGREHQEQPPLRSWYNWCCSCCEKIYPCVQNGPILAAVSIILLASVGVNIVQFSLC